MTVKIAATGSYLPERAISNQALDQFPAGARELIAVKTGVRERRRASPDQSTSDLAAEAAKRCLEQAARDPTDVGAVIVSTSSPDRLQPATASRAQALIGASNAFAFDINSVCSGSVFGIALGDSLIRSGQVANVLLVGAEIYSRILDPRDFRTYPYFGDGAGAVLLTRTSDANAVLASRLRTDGSRCETIRVPGGGTMLPFDRLGQPDCPSPYFAMNGKAVFEFAVSAGAEIIREVLDDAKVHLSDVRQFVCHQANVNILEGIAGALGVSSERFFMNLDRYGNTASASVLIALDEARRDGQIAEGDLVVTAAFGGGLSWGANVLRI